MEVQRTTLGVFPGRAEGLKDSPAEAGVGPWACRLVGELCRDLASEFCESPSQPGGDPTLGKWRNRAAAIRAG